MKRVFLAIALSIMLITSGCSNSSEPKLSEEEIISIVLKNHTSHIGKVKILSIAHNGNEYIVEWEIKENCEYGTDYINDQNGEIKKGETTIC